MKSLPYSSLEIENILIAFGWKKPNYLFHEPWKKNKYPWNMASDMIDAWNIEFGN